MMAAGGRGGTLRFQAISQAATPAVFVRPSESIHGLERREPVFRPATALFPVLLGDGLSILDTELIPTCLGMACPSWTPS